MAIDHNLEDCPHNPTFEHIIGTLKRLDTHGERTAVAMEELARNSAVVDGLSKQVDKNEHDLREVFGRVRMIENGKAEVSDVKAIDVRVKAIELVHAKEDGSEELIEKKYKFWENVKIQLADKLILFIIFVLVVADKFNVFVWLHKLWKELLG